MVMILLKKLIISAGAKWVNKMIITEKQLIILFDIAKFVITHEFNRLNNYDRQTIVDVVNEILNQQSNELIEVK